MSSSRKLDFRWLGPYQIKAVNKEKGYYRLKELGPDGPTLKGTFSGSRLKLFFQREHYFYSPEDVLSPEPTSESSRSEDLEDIKSQEEDTTQLR